jgi:hypothetical protein
MCMANRPNCSCGNPISQSNYNGNFYETDYCSTYCREYYTQGLKPLSLFEKTGSKHHINHYEMPVIKSKCVCCDAEMEIKPYKADKGRTQTYCGRECLQKIRQANCRRPTIVFNMLCMLKHRRRFNIYDGWMSADDVMEIMSKMKTHSAKNSYPSILRVWASRGFIEKIDRRWANGKHNPTQYRISEEAMNRPLGEVFFEGIGQKFNHD